MLAATSVYIQACWYFLYQSTFTFYYNNLLQHNCFYYYYCFIFFTCTGSLQHSKLQKQKKGKYNKMCRMNVAHGV